MSVVCDPADDDIPLSGQFSVCGSDYSPTTPGSRATSDEKAACERYTYVKRSPCIVVEVLSETTEATDRRQKLEAYLLLPGLRYYLFVSSQTRRVEYYARDAGGDWETALLEDGEQLDLRAVRRLPRGSGPGADL